MLRTAALVLLLSLTGLLPDAAGRAAPSEAAPARTPRSEGAGEPPSAERIAWFGTWDQAARAARATNRPILLVSAAPHCRAVPGMW